MVQGSRIILNSNVVLITAEFRALHNCPERNNPERNNPERNNPERNNPETRKNPKH